VSERRRIRLQLSPEAERYARRDAPLEVRRLAAGGALPLPPVELVTVLFVLAHDSDAAVKDRARTSLAKLPESVLGAALSGATHPAVLSWCADAFGDQPERLEKIALNPQTDDATIARLAAAPHKRIVDIVSNNQERMLRCPEIVDALGTNPLTGRSVIDRILSFLGLQRAAHEVTDEPEEDLDFGSVEPVNDAEARALLESLLGDDVSAFARELIDDGVEADEELQKNLHSLLQRMTVFEKVKLARVGNHEARSLLVRDRNKLVAAAAVKSPKVTENEVLAFSKARNVSDEVLRIIARNPDWTRSYQVKLALAGNPRTPQQTAIKFLNYLQDRDLRGIMKSRDVPAVVTTHARRILQRKEK
jgi:hypothetical protein